MQEVHNVIEGVFVDILAHCLAKLQLVQLIQAGQAVLRLKRKEVGRDILVEKKVTVKY